MYFKLIHKLPERIILACSGGIDSMAALHWLDRGHKLSGVVHMNHGTGEFADEAEELVRKACTTLGVDLAVHRLLESPPLGESKENWWRIKRYEFFLQEAKMTDCLIATAHNLDDCVEEYVINAVIRGRHGTIPYQHGPVVRPFRTWSRDDITDYAIRHGVKWLEDPSNTNPNFLRNKIRHQTLSHLYDLNPGLHNMVRRMIEVEGLD